MDQLRPVGRASAQPRLEGVERRLAGRVGEHPVEEREGVVPGGAVRGPLPREPLTRLEDLLHQRVATVGEAREVVEVALRVAQAVGVVDPKPVDESFLEPAANLDVRVGEDLGLLDAYAGEGAHGEEAPVVQVAVAAPPADELVVLSPVYLVGSAVRRAGRDREPVVVVPQLVADHLEVTGRAVVDRQVVVTEHRHQQLALAELPVDVERLGMLGGRGRAGARPTTRG